MYLYQTLGTLNYFLFFIPIKEVHLKLFVTGPHIPRRLRTERRHYDLWPTSVFVSFFSSVVYLSIGNPKRTPFVFIILISVFPQDCLSYYRTVHSPGIMVWDTSGDVVFETSLNQCFPVDVSYSDKSLLTRHVSITKVCFPRI